MTIPAPRAFFLAVLVLLIPALGMPAIVLSQDSEPSPRSTATGSRPVVVLALSGGGARALTEIGVIKWMEENHIPVDRVEGTSMGCIIASMYATGMSPAEIQAFAEKIDWDQAFIT